MIFLTSDLHIGHLNIIKYCRKDFEFSQAGRLQCDNLILKNYNNLVSDKDIVIILGDAYFSDLEYATDYFAKLHGIRLLIKGNHDQRSNRFYISNLGFKACFDFIAFEDLFFCHYPLDEIDSKKESYLRQEFEKGNFRTIYHGHIHDKDPVKRNGINRINVSVDYKPNNYSPLKLDQPDFEDYLRKQFLTP